MKSENLEVQKRYYWLGIFLSAFLAAIGLFGFPATNSDGYFGVVVGIIDAFGIVFIGFFGIMFSIGAISALGGRKNKHPILVSIAIVIAIINIFIIYRAWS